MRVILDFFENKLKKGFSFLENSSVLFYLFLFIILFKFLCLAVFSSDYQNVLFIPFVKHFVDCGGNPWEWVYQTGNGPEFPYHPLMLYVFSIGALFIKIFHITNIVGINILFKMPILIADIGIFYLFTKIVNNKYKALLYYFCSPIIIYASYMHSQLDIVPIAAIFYSFYLLKKKKIYQASVWFAVSCLFKLNAVLLLPIFLIYLCKNNNLIKTLLSFLCSSLVYFLFSIPYIFSEGYKNLVLLNSKQNLFFNLHVDLGQVMVYIPLLCVLLLYLRFASYKKINNSLLDSFCCLIISSFLIFIQPTSPAWYVWLIPFLVLFVINFSTQNGYIKKVYFILNATYIIYFLVFHISEYPDLLFLTNYIDIKIHNPFLQSCVFTLMETFLISIIYLTYKIAIKSNSIYKKEKAILIGISGDSGAGKSNLLKDLQQILTCNLLTLEGDGTHKWERGDENWLHYTHLDPKANYLHSQLQMLADLKNFKTTFYREYNHETGTFEYRDKVIPKQFIALAGLHTFYLPKMRKILDLKIYLDTQKELQTFWKIRRDMEERGHSPDNIKKSIELREKDSLKYIEPQKNFADVVIKYYSDSNVIENESDINLKLRIDLDSSVSIDAILNYLKLNNADFEWDYSDDLKTQYIICHSQSGLEQIADVIRTNIENIEEILCNDSEINSGYRGLVQCILLLILSNKMKGNDV